ncbi:hypothetical protein BFP72_03665 [Reichenbachiella sp. 5M10]|uniref:hypothetical protein n=1 Tax=Reichenbachiella sp. 5M10 TaxID=1889772 RepID=UPI000C159E24|nr:hypothetical protein [Reichenbachiella sp. 5M10]PIB34568.1 hypothetical protein BFP72_03665 [Reichenbachiella sp. 5M10]
MKDRIKEIDELFSMFHDFEIVGLKVDGNILTFEILLPWSEMWGIEDYIMTFRFDGCNGLKCHYWKRTSNELKEWEKGVYYPSQEYITTDLNEIIKLELDVQNHEFKEPDNFILHCNSSSSHGDQIGQIEFGRIELNAKDYRIYDNEMNEMTLDKMKSWGTEWWNSIQKMWDEQK